MENEFHHGYKQVTIRNKETGRTENIRSKHNYFLKDVKKEKKKIKDNLSGGDYDVISVKLS